MKWFLIALRKYAVFSGRARRLEYWNFVFFLVMGNLATSLLDMLLGTWNEVLGTGLLAFLFGLSMLIPGFAVAARRLHDTNRSGWWQLLSLTIIGIIPLLAFLLSSGQAGPNRFGPDPKAEPTAREVERELVHT